MDSTLWAGPEVTATAARRGQRALQGTVRQQPLSLCLGFAADDFSYAIDIGLPTPVPRTAFQRDPEIKRECIWSGPLQRPGALQVDRRGPLVKVRQDDGAWDIVDAHIAGYDSMLTRVADPRRAPEVLLLREQIRGWRFYDHFRTDAEAPARQPQTGTRTPVLTHDGRDLAAALQTIREIGDGEALDAAIDDAFPGARVDIINAEGRFAVQLQQEGLLRPLSAAELSDGTLRYLLWIAALLTPRPPALMVLNEPETSLHPDLLPALARLIAVAAQHAQLWVVSHATRLIAALEQHAACQTLVLEKRMSETAIMGLHELDQPAWHWMER